MTAPRLCAPPPLLWRHGAATTRRARRGASNLLATPALLSRGCRQALAPQWGCCWGVALRRGCCQPALRPLRGCRQPAPRLLRGRRQPAPRPLRGRCQPAPRLLRRRHRLLCWWTTTRSARRGALLCCAPKRTSCRARGQRALSSLCKGSRSARGRRALGEQAGDGGTLLAQYMVLKMVHATAGGSVFSITVCLGGATETAQKWAAGYSQNSMASPTGGSLDACVSVNA